MFQLTLQHGPRAKNEEHMLQPNEKNPQWTHLLQANSAKGVQFSDLGLSDNFLKLSLATPEAQITLPRENGSPWHHGVRSRGHDDFFLTL